MSVFQSNIGGSLSKRSSLVLLFDSYLGKGFFSNILFLCAVVTLVVENEYFLMKNLFGVKGMIFRLVKTFSVFFLSCSSISALDIFTIFSICIFVIMIAIFINKIAMRFHLRTL